MFQREKYKIYLFYQGLNHYVESLKQIQITRGTADLFCNLAVRSAIITQKIRPRCNLNFKKIQNNFINNRLLLYRRYIYLGQ